MARTLIKAIGGDAPQTLPPPYSGTLAPGQGTIVADSKSTVIANLGGAGALLYTWQVEGLADAAAPLGPFTPTTAAAGIVAALAATATAVDFNTQKITGLVDPTSAQHAATKNYADTAAKPQWKFAAPTTLTIASGVVTATQAVHKIDTEAASTSDDLDTISGGSAGQLLLIAQVASARNVVIKQATDHGNIQCPEGLDITLDVVDDCALLYNNGTSWDVIAYVTASVSGGGLGLALAGTGAPAGTPGISLIGAGALANATASTTLQALLIEVLARITALEAA